MARFTVRQARNGRANNPHRNWIVEDTASKLRLVFPTWEYAILAADTWARRGRIIPDLLISAMAHWNPDAR